MENKDDSKGRSRRKTSIQGKFLLFSVIFFLIILAGGMGAFYLSMSQIVKTDAAQELTRLLETQRIELAASVNAEIAIALKMADSPLIQSYFLQPGDPELERLAFREIAGYRRSFGSKTVFWINDADKRFYSDDAYSYTVDPDDPDQYWYKMTMYETESFNFNINYNDVLKKTMLWINAPVFDSGPGGRKIPIGLVGTGIDLTGFTDAIYDTEATANLYLFNEGAEITGAKDSSLIFDKKTMIDRFGDLGNTMVSAAKDLAPEEIYIFSSPAGEAALGRIQQLNWYMAALLPITPAMYLKSAMTGLFLAMLLVILVIFIIINAFILNILKPLKYAIGVLKEIAAEWDLTKRVTVRNNDEIGSLADFLNLTFEKMKDLILVIKNQTESLSNTGSDLAANTTETAAAINEITANTQSMKGQITNQVEGVTETGGAMGRIMENVDKLNEHIANQADSVAQSSSAIEEMLANIHSVAETLVRNTANVQTLAESSDVGRTDLQTVATDIQEIARESEGLLEINAVMENIASQTNLLSMNAAIEAAHAGEAGKGFAVVADEIRKLAESSGEQSKTISTVLKKIKASIDSITQSTDVVLKRFETIEQEVKTVSDQEASIRAAMEEQEIGSRHILEAVTQLNALTDLVRRGSEDMAVDGRDAMKRSDSLARITREIENGMDEMAKGAEQINIAVNRVNEISVANRDNIGALGTEVSKFKVTA
ncbi:methyl-accepting chemotaxis protein [Spirochaetia bacterium]|nr:methyl-accepting chemotaxis protein [Spirochaetia bacterium]